MLKVAIVTATLVAICFSSSPLYETEHYKVFSFNSKRLQLTEAKENRQYQENVDGSVKTIIERPTNSSVPEDDGSAQFGDIEFAGLRRDGELVIRDTIVNQINNENVYIFYNRTLPGYYVEDMRIYNVGRQRGWVYRALIGHNVGYVETQLLIAAGNTVRIFVEIFVRADEEMREISHFDVNKHFVL